MNIQPLELKGAALITLRKFGDNRGFFNERFRVDQWQAAFPEHTGFIQDNYSWSKPGVLRGLHCQLGPDQGKLVTCIEGSIVDVIVDIRPDSPTFKRHLKVSLSADEPQWLWVPPGFAHGFVVTSAGGAGVLYKVDQPYTPKAEWAIHWNDPELAIEWPAAHPILSEKDDAAPSLREFLNARGKS